MVNFWETPICWSSGATNPRMTLVRCLSLCPSIRGRIGIGPPDRSPPSLRCMPEQAGKNTGHAGDPDSLTVIEFEPSRYAQLVRMAGHDIIHYIRRSPKGPPMPRSIRHCRLPWLALAAIAGMLSMAGELRACSTTASESRSCCVDRPSADCRCCEAAEPTAIETSSSQVATETGCHCRSDRTSSPISGRESSPTKPRSDPGRSASLEDEANFHRKTPFAAIGREIVEPPKVATFLRLGRLLI